MNRATAAIAAVMQAHGRVVLLRAEEPLEEGEQELDPDLRAPIEPPTEDELRLDFAVFLDSVE